MEIKKKHIIMIAICVLLIGALLIYKLCFNKTGSNTNYTYATKGQVAKAVALLNYSKDECSAITNRFENPKGEWYEKYMNAMYELGFYDVESIKATELSPNIALTYGDLNTIVTGLNVNDEWINERLEKKSTRAKVTEEEWLNIYTKLVEAKGNSVVSNVQLTVVATASNVVGLGAWEAVTDNGRYGFEGIAIDYYMDTRVNVYTSGKEIICIMGVDSQIVTYDNAWVLSCDGENIKAHVFGITRNFNGKMSNEVDLKNVINTVADITVTSKVVTNLALKKDTITGKVLSITDEYVDIEGKGKVYFAENKYIYKVYGKLEDKTVKDVLVGYDAQKFVVADGKIQAVVIDRDINAKNIRVLLRTEDFKGMYHDKVVVSSTGGMTIYSGNAKYVVSAGEKIIIELDSGLLELGRVKFESNDIKGKITIDSLVRNYGAPSYRGTIEVSKGEKGLLIVNEVPLEEYLYAVVPSEMPSYYPLEALKVQAVCARTYAYKHLLQNTYYKYGAHIDDSASFQVYNNVEEQDMTNDAVNDTYGQILTHKDEPIMAYFFSTSCGATCDGTIWGSEIPYLKSIFLASGDKLDLSDENTFANFIKTEYDCYEKGTTWFRWSYTMPLDHLNKIIDAELTLVYNKNANHLLTKNAAGKYVKKPFTTVGKVQELRVEKRGNGGVVEEFVIVGSECTVKVLYQNNVRNFLNPEGLEFTRNGETYVTTMNTSPSAYIALEEVREAGILSGYKIYGGGYGHGAGMSQVGAMALAEQLYKYDVILKMFYNDVEIDALY